MKLSAHAPNHTSLVKVVSWLGLARFASGTDLIIFIDQRSRDGSSRINSGVQIKTLSASLQRNSSSILGEEPSLCGRTMTLPALQDE